jgi:hypothetical protein
MEKNPGAANRRFPLTPEAGRNKNNPYPCGSPFRATGKTVRVRRGPAAVTGDKGRSTSLFMRTLLSYKVGMVQNLGRLRKKLQRQGTRLLRNEAYCFVRRSDEGGSGTPHMDFLRSR